MTLMRINWKFLPMHFLAVCLANASFWIISGAIFLNRPLFSYDTIIALVVAVFHKPIGGFLLLVAWFSDGLVSQSLTYQFLSPIDFLQSARFSGELDWRHFLSYWQVIGILIFSVFLYLLRVIYNRTPASAGSSANLFFIGLLLIALDAANGASDIWRKDTMIVPINIAGSPSFTLVKSAFKPPEKRGLRKITNDHSISKKFDVVAWASTHPDRSILFVVVESLGIPKSDDALEFLRQSVLVNSYKTNFYQIEFRGATTSGELRSLCGLEGSYTAANTSNGNDCLPAQLSKLGWQTSGFHGFSNRVFDRQYWWPTIGLDRVFFIESPEVAVLNRCGNVFRGACDHALVDLAISHIATPKSFAYVLTLNTHLPVVPIELPTKLSDICYIDAVPKVACMHIAALRDVLQSIVIGTSSLPTRPLIVIVGDHAPPFSAINERGAFRQDVVPGFVLEPKI